MNRLHTLSTVTSNQSLLDSGLYSSAEIRIEYLKTSAVWRSAQISKPTPVNFPVHCACQTSLNPDSERTASRSNMKYSQSRQSGFTLIEVMVALAILAVVAVAASRASSAYLRSVDVLKTRTLAHFVAQNTAADLRINQAWLSADQSRQVQSQGRDWQVQLSVSDTMTPAIKSVTITVAPIIDGTAKNSVTDITVMISNPNEASGLNGMGQRQ